METNAEKKVEWIPLAGGGESYKVQISQALRGGTLIAPVKKLIKDIPSFAVRCMNCGKIHRLADLLEICPNCSSASYTYGGSPSQLSIICARCGSGILQSVTCACGCVNPLNERTLREPKTGGCFIATATYDSPLAPEVAVFRHYRDEVLLPSKLGSLFVKVYYFASPPLAAFIGRNNILKKATRHFVLTPLLRMLRIRNERNSKL